MPEPLAFEPGQVWSYQGAKIATSRVIVGRVDRSATSDLDVVSIVLTGVPLPDPKTGILEPKEVHHAPMEEQALRSSVIACVGQRDVPTDFEEGYRIWRAAFDEGKAGAFTVPVGDLQNIFLTILTQNAGKPQ